MHRTVKVHNYLAAIKISFFVVESFIFSRVLSLILQLEVFPKKNRNLGAYEQQPYTVAGIVSSVLQNILLLVNILNDSKPVRICSQLAKFV